LVPALLMQRRIRAEGEHHHLISASIAGAVTLVAGSCLLPILALHCLWDSRLASSSCRCRRRRAAADCEPDPAGGLRAGHVCRPMGRRAVAATRIDGAHDGGVAGPACHGLLISLASVAYLLRALSAGAPTIGRGLVVATVVGAAVQFLLARVLASRWLRAQAS
jgi:hypothetical protein